MFYALYFVLYTLHLIPGAARPHERGAAAAHRGAELGVQRRVAHTDVSDARAEQPAVEVEPVRKRLWSKTSPANAGFGYSQSSFSIGGVGSEHASGSCEGRPSKQHRAHGAGESSLPTAGSSEARPTKKRHVYGVLLWEEKIIKFLETHHRKPLESSDKEEAALARYIRKNTATVSYTHLTLPTIYSV